MPSHCSRTTTGPMERLFKEFEGAGDRAYVTKRRIVDRIIEETSRHAAIEEQLLYPNVRAKVPGADAEVLESLEEHHVVKWLLAELESDPARRRAVRRSGRRADRERPAPRRRGGERPVPAGA